MHGGKVIFTLINDYIYSTLIMQGWASYPMLYVMYIMHISSYFSLFKTIVSYKNSGSTPVKILIGHYKINLEALKKLLKL
jgi:hypothetical protein